MAEGTFSPLPIGTVVYERYRIGAVVGRGGLGTVYRVSDILYGRGNVYALKELIDQSSGARKQFENESQWLQSLNSNSIPKVREHFEWHGRLYLVMDFVDGENLEQMLARNGGRPLPERQVLAWIVPVCGALQYLHTRIPPILHRDVKPANIIVTPAGHPVLVDLGIAKEHLPGAGQTATFVRKAGTEGYAPPEQYAAGGQTGPWSDVYGLGATLYHLLTGTVPPTAVERVALDARLLRPRELNPAVSPATDLAVSRALGLRPMERYQSIADFARALTSPSGPPSALHAISPVPSAPSAPSPSGPSIPHSVPPARLSPMTGSLPSVAPSVPPRSQSSTPSDTAAYLAAVPPDREAAIASAIERARRLQSAADLGASDREAAIASAIERARRLQSAADLGAPDAGVPSAARLNEDTPHGRSTAQPRGAATPKAARARKGRRFRSPIVLGAVLVCVIIALIAVSVAVLSATMPPDRSTPRIAITGYFNALRDQNYSRAWQYVAQSRNGSGSEAAFIASLRTDDTRDGRVLSSRITQLDDTNGNVTAQVDVVRAHDPTMNITYSLELSQADGDTWLISSITSL